MDRPEKGSRRSLSIAQQSGRRDRLPPEETFHFQSVVKAEPTSEFNDTVRDNDLLLPYRLVGPPLADLDGTALGQFGTYEV